MLAGSAHAGARPEAQRAAGGSSAVDFARRRGHTECAALLLRAPPALPLRATPAAAARHTWGRPSSSAVGASASAQPVAAAGYCAAPRRAFSDGTISITIASAHGSWTNDVKLGETLMDIALDNDLDSRFASNLSLLVAAARPFSETLLVGYSGVRMRGPDGLLDLPCLRR